MTRFIDKTGRIIEIRMCRWNGSGYDPDWEQDFFAVGDLQYDDEKEAYIVDDVDYLVDYANDWKNNTGDFAIDDSDKGDEYIFIEEA